MSNVRTNIYLVAAGAAMLTAAVAAHAQTPQEQAEFTRLINQRNELYAQLSVLGDKSAVASGGEAAAIAGEAKWAQNQLDIVEDRLSDLAAANDWAVPSLPRGDTRTDLTGNPVMYAAGPGASPTTSAKERAEFNKLVYQRNKLHAQLLQLDEQASDLLKGGKRPVVVYASQVSVQDQLDLIELRLAILSTRYGMTVPPVPGRDPGPGGAIAAADDLADRHVDKAFARGRERAMNALRKDCDRFLASLDFGAFLND